MSKESPFRLRLLRTPIGLVEAMMQGADGVDVQIEPCNPETVLKLGLPIEVVIVSGF